MTEPQPAMSSITLHANQLVRLLDMLRFYAAKFVKSVNQLQILLSEIEQWIQDRSTDSRLRRPEVRRVVSVVSTVDHECENLRLRRALETIALFRPHIQKPNGAPALGSKVTLQMLQLRIQDIQKSVFMDLYDLAFIYIPEDKQEYVDRDWLFDDDEVQVSKAFPEAGADIRASGHCYAVGMYTACVFHLMRVVEIGARKMVSDLKARQHLANPRKPIELCDWGELIRAIDTAVGQLSAGSRISMAKKNKFEFYNHAAAQFRNFKDAWRNNVSHSRREYRHGGAKDVMDNTRQFMRHLSLHRKRPK